MTIRFILIIVFVCLTSLGFTQGEANSLKGVSPKERIVPGGGVGLSFGPYQDYIMVSPFIGYMVTRRFMPGISMSYTYLKYKDVIPGRDLSVNNYGVGPFVRFIISQNFFAHIEYEYVSYEWPQSDLSTIRLGYESIFIGGGYILPLGSEGSVNFIALYNVTYADPRPGEFIPYDTPWVLRVGFTFGNVSF